MKATRYVTLERRFLDEYISQLANMGYMKAGPGASLQAAPHLVPKDSKTVFRIANVFRLVNIATIAKQSPMPVIEA